MEKNKQFNSESTINFEEVHQFDKIANSWWDEAGPFKPLHLMNPCRLKFIKDHLLRQFSKAKLEMNGDSLDRHITLAMTEEVRHCEERERRGNLGNFNLDEPIKNFSPLKNLRLLDIGCGGGLLSEPLTQLGASVTGIDASPIAIHTAHEHAQENGLNIDYQCTSIEEFKSDKFDAILALEIIEHVNDPSLFIQNCARLLKPNGLLFLSTLNRNWKSYLGAIVGAEYLLRWVPIGTHDWHKFKEPSELAHLLRDNGLQFIDLKGMSYHPLKQEWSLVPSLKINYIGCAYFI